MLRAFIITLSKAAWAQRLIANWPLAWRVASRYVAGETHQDALRVVQELNRKGIAGSLDHLGENTTSAVEAARAADEVLLLLDQIAASRVRANVSLKLSQIGQVLDESLCRSNLSRILEAARALGIFIRIDMEDSSLTQPTLDTYFWARGQGFDNLGVVIQSALYRSRDDIHRLGEVGAKVRLCKGAYREPPEIAYPKKRDVDANYDHLTEQLLANALAHGAPPAAADGKVPPIPAIATHDPRRIRFSQETAERLCLPREAVEYQMLYGIRRDLQEKLAAEGYPVRVYVPYGTHWYPYLMRRLAERPANLWFFLSNFFKR